MRSVSFTFLLAIVALIFGGLAVIRVAEGNLARVFGAPATDLGQPLYDFDIADVRQIYLAGNGVSAYCRRDDKLGWQVISPWKDRMDPRIAQSLLAFTLGSRVEGAIPTEKLESSSFSVGEGRADARIGVRIADGEGDPLAKFFLGRRTAWFGTDAESGKTIPTLFVQPRDRSRKDFIYACTDPQDIHSVLGDGFRRLRDHHPFLFHPTIVQSLRIRNRSGELLLARDDPKQLWKITKPLELKADKQALVSLLQGLYDLEAVSVMSRSEVTLPADDPKTLEQIALRFFGMEEEVVLELFPPEDEEATTVLARINNRPNTIFELPLRSTPSAAEEKTPVSLADLPLTVNELRDPTLSAIDVTAVKGILIEPDLGEEILLTRADPKGRFKVILDGELREPNDTALFTLLKTVTEGRVSGFVTDSATDLSAYGLDNPFLSLRFLGFDKSILQLDFGRNEDGDVLAIRQGSTTVFRIDPSMLSLIPTNPWEWRNTQLWSISDYDLKTIERNIGDEPGMRLDCGGIIEENWRIRVDGKDRTAELATDRAGRFISYITGLKAQAWLRPQHEIASKALTHPDLVLRIYANTFDDEGEDAGIVRHELSVAGVPVGDSMIYYAMSSTANQPFTLSTADYERLTVDLFDLD